MKIRSHKQQPRGKSRGGRAMRFIAVCSVIAFGAVSGSNASAQSNGTVEHGNEAFRVVSAADYLAANKSPRPNQAARPSQAARASQAVQPVAFQAGCTSCGTSCGGSCGASVACGSCGTSCGGACGAFGGVFGGGSINDCRSGRGGPVSPFIGFGNPCGSCDPFVYGSFEVLYMERDDKAKFQLSPQLFPGDFSAEAGARTTIGWVSDCVHGYEFTYTGRLQWDAPAVATVPPFGSIQTVLEAGAPFVPTDLSAFNDNPIGAVQDYRADFWSVEANRISVGWDIAKCVVGVRYIDYDEAFAYISRNGAGQTGLLATSTENRMIGAHLGLDLLYPISRNGFTDFRSRVGAFMNFAESNFALINDGTFLLLSEDDKTELAGVLEIGGGIRYHVGQHVSFRLGAELWYLKEVAAVSDQFTRVIRPGTGRTIRVRSDFLVTGVSFGTEIRF